MGSSPGGCPTGDDGVEALNRVGRRLLSRGPVPALDGGPAGGVVPALC